MTGQLGTGWSTNTTATLATNVSGLSYCFTATNDVAARFCRIQTAP
ncbi:MAG: hypothetical protein ABSE90_03610 [Verrucomicrobiota bacterium]